MPIAVGDSSLCIKRFPTGVCCEGVVNNTGVDIAEETIVPTRRISGLFRGNDLPLRRRFSEYSPMQRV